MFGFTVFKTSKSFFFQWRIQGRAPPPLICKPNEAQRPKKKLFWDLFLNHFGLKLGIEFAYFDLNLGMVFEGIWECMNVFFISIPNE